ncbi:MAG: hypothetical protein SGARI_000892 [Bacillariaceae sp.]
MSEDEIQDMLNTAMSSGNQMINLLNDILKLSKDRHMEHLINKEEVTMKALVSEPVENLLEVASGQRIEMTFRINADETAAITTDKSKVQQIISNLCNNAIKFCSAGAKISVDFTLAPSMNEAVDEWAEKALKYEGTVFNMEGDDLLYSVEAVMKKMSRLSVTDEKKWLVISVEDSGCGIMKTELAEMLKAYTQSSRGTNRTFQGTGLGLFICMSLCQQLQGYIGCSSTPGIGTVFNIGIPH